jgi:hypothetical protein
LGVVDVGGRAGTPDELRADFLDEKGARGTVGRGARQGSRGCRKLFSFAETEVRELVRGTLGGVQTPQVFRTNNSFAIGMFGAEELKAITPGAARVRILRPEGFIDRDKGYDLLDLGKALSEALQEQNRVVSRGEAGKTWFVDGEGIPGALAPSGSYTVDGRGHVLVTLILLDRSRKDPKVAEMKIEGESEDLKGLCAGLMKAIYEAAGSYGYESLSSRRSERLRRGRSGLSYKLGDLG